MHLEEDQVQHCREHEADFKRKVTESGIGRGQNSDVLRLVGEEPDRNHYADSHGDKTGPGVVLSIKHESIHVVPTAKELVHEEHTQPWANPVGDDQEEIGVLVDVGQRDPAKQAAQDP